MPPQTDPPATAATSDAYYRDPAVIANMARRGSEGLRPWEADVLGRHHTEDALLLDIGAGAGREAQALANAGLDVVALDRCAPLLSARVFGGPCCCGDAAHLPFADGAFGQAIAWSQVFAHLTAPEIRRAGFAELRRVLAAGARVSASVHDLDDTQAMHGGVDATALGGGNFRIRDHDGVCDWHYYTQGELLELSRDAGFTTVSCRRAGAHGDSVRDNLWIWLAIAN